MINEDFIVKIIVCVIIGIFLFSMSILIAGAANNYIHCRQDGCNKLHCYANIVNYADVCFDQYKEIK